MTTIHFFLEHHHNLYFEPGGVLEQLKGLTDEQMRLCPKNLNSIAWILWHISRCEDVGINRLVCDHQQVLAEEDFSVLMKIPRRDIGTSMTFEEIVELSNQIDINSLQRYNTAVATRTEIIIPNLIPEELDIVPDPNFLKKVLFDEAVLTVNSEWVSQHYSNKTKGWFLGHLGLTHCKGHLGQIILLRKLLELGTAEKRIFK